MQRKVTIIATMALRFNLRWQEYAKFAKNNFELMVIASKQCYILNSTQFSINKGHSHFIYKMTTDDGRAHHLNLK